MTIGGWLIFAFLAVTILVAGICGALVSDTTAGTVIVIMITFSLIIGLLFGMLWYFDNTASGQRAIIDQKSNLNNGLQRTITVYTADGSIIATYTGFIDIDMNDGGYVKFDFEGKRYIYYNCFVESIADIS